MICFICGQMDGWLEYLSESERLLHYNVTGLAHHQCIGYACWGNCPAMGCREICELIGRIGYFDSVDRLSAETHLIGNGSGGGGDGGPIELCRPSQVLYISHIAHRQEKQNRIVTPPPPLKRPLEIVEPTNQFIGHYAERILR